MLKLINVDKIERIKIPEVNIWDVSLEETYNLSKEMIEFIKKDKELGLSACQVGVFKQMFIMKYDNSFKLIINPQKPKSLNSGKTKKYQEGCLSLPNEIYHTRRFISIWTEFYTIRNLPEIHFVKEHLIFRNLEACIFLHEFQHLQGITLRMVGMKLIN